MAHTRGPGPRRIECGDGCIEHGIGGDAGQAVRYVADAAYRRLPNAVARTTWQLDANHAIRRSGWRVAGGRGRAKDRDDRRANGGGEVHWARVAGDEEMQAFNQRC